MKLNEEEINYAKNDVKEVKIVEKTTRLKERIIEMNELNTNIARLAFYLNENKIDDPDYEIELRNQLSAMVTYSKVLETRILNGWY